MGKLKVIITIVVIAVLAIIGVNLLKKKPATATTTLKAPAVEVKAATDVEKPQVTVTAPDVKAEVTVK